MFFKTTHEFDMSAYANTQDRIKWQLVRRSEELGRKIAEAYPFEQVYRNGQSPMAVRYELELFVVRKSDWDDFIFKLEILFENNPDALHDVKKTIREQLCQPKQPNP